MSSPTVAVHFVAPAAVRLRQSGYDIEPVLRKAGVPGALLGQHHTRITVEQATLLIRGLMEACDDELFRMAPHPVARGTFKLLSLAVIHSRDLRTVLRRSTEFARILPGSPDVTIELDASVARVELDFAGLDDPTHLVTDTLLCLVHRFAGWLIGRRIKLHAVELPFARPWYWNEYQTLFGCAPRFDARAAALSFDSALLAAPVIRSHDDLLAYLRRSPADLLTRRDYSSTTSDQVRTILERGLRGRWPSSDEVAGRLALSLQHVRRLLREEGTSLRQIKEDLLRDAAIASLMAGQEPVYELSERLGFSEPSAFRRAFRRWTGSPPGSYHPSGDEL